MAKRWWRKRALRIYHPHMSVHEMVSLDVPAFVAACVETNAEAIVVNAAGLYAYYPTKVPCHHIPEALGDRDLLGEIVEGLRGQGLRVIAGCDFSRVRRDDAEAHPEWMALGGPGDELWQTCPASPYQRGAYASPVIQELLREYRIDGLYLVGLDWKRQSKCPACEAAFAREQGDASGGGIRDAETFRAWRMRASAAQRRALYDSAQEIRPDVFFFTQMSRWAEGVTGEQIVALRSSQSVPCLSALSTRQRAVGAVGRIVEMGRGARRRRSPVVVVPSENADALPMRASETQRLAFQAVSHGASLMIETHGDPSAPLARHALDAGRQALGMMRDRADTQDGFKPIQPVAIIWPAGQPDERQFHQTRRARRLEACSAGALADALGARHQSYAILHVERLSAKALSRHEVAVVPSVEMLDATVWAMLETYAGNGGRVLVFGQILGDGTYADSCQAVAKSLGLGLTRCESRSPIAVPNVGDGAPHWRGPTPTALHVGQASNAIHDAGENVVWLWRTGDTPRRNRNDARRPRIATKEPVMVTGVVGEGMLTFCAAEAAALARSGAAFWDLIAQAVHYGAQLPPRLEVDAPACIEVTMAHWREGIVIHLVNHAGALMGDVTPVGPISLDLAWDGPAQVVLAAPGQPDQALPAVEHWNRVTITVPRVEVYAQVVVRTG